MIRASKDGIIFSHTTETRETIGREQREYFRSKIENALRSSVSDWTLRNFGKGKKERVRKE